MTVTRTLLVAMGIAIGLSFVGAPARGIARADDAKEAEKKEAEKPKKAVDSADVYYGDSRAWAKPAEVDPDQVYAKIDEYKEILEKGLKPGDAKYELLLCKASKRFTCAVKKAAKDGTYDLVAKSGAVKGVEEVPDLTADVIAKL
jgi:Skp family chaperone for outer membrane proteins